MMKNKKKYKTVLFISFFLSAMNTLHADILLNAGTFLHFSKKKTIPIDNNKIKQEPMLENFFYPGISTGLDFPFQPNSVGIITHLNIVWGVKQIRLNQYNIQNYEYNFIDENGEPRSTINTCMYGGIVRSCTGTPVGSSYGRLVDYNLQEKVSQYLNEHPEGVLTEVYDLVIHSSVLMKYATPVNIPGNNPILKNISLVLSYINPYVAAGFSTMMINRKFVKPGDEIILALSKENGMPVCTFSNSNCRNEIFGKDQSPDPDFFLTIGTGLNIAPPIMKILDIQNVLTVEFLYHFGLSPDDTNKPYDDIYDITHRGYSIRISMGLVI